MMAANHKTNIQNTNNKLLETKEEEISCIHTHTMSS
jgi:hypothetical protein